MAFNDYVTMCSNSKCNMQYFYAPDRTNKKEICDKCGAKLIHTTITAEEMFLIERVSEDRDFINAMIKLKDDNIIEYKSRIAQWREDAKRAGCYGKEEQAKYNPQPSTTTKCPRCGGTAFTPMKKKWSLLAGFATNQVELVCNNCGYKMKAK